MADMYIGVAGVSRVVKTGYIGVAGVSRTAKAGYIGVNGVARQFLRGGVALKDIAEESIVKLNENGSPVEFYVAKQNYESGLNGSGRVLVVRKYVYGDQQWNNSKVNTYATCYLDAWFNGDYKNMLDTAIRTAMGTTKFYYTHGYKDDTVGTLERSVFALSGTELGQSDPEMNVEGSALPTASILQVAYRNGTARDQCTRSPVLQSYNGSWYLNSDGKPAYSGSTFARGSRPAFTLPGTSMFDLSTMEFIE